MKEIDKLKSLAENENSETLRLAERALRDCYDALMESGQLEVRPPRSLVNFFKSYECDEDGF